MHQAKKRDKKLRAKRKGGGGAPRHGHSGHKRSDADLVKLVISEVTEDGDLLAIPAEWKSRKLPPRIFIMTSKMGLSPVPGDHVLAKMRKIDWHEFQAHVVRILPKEEARQVIGIFVPKSGGGGLIEPVSRKVKESFHVAREDVNGAVPGELVKGTTAGGNFAKVEERLGDARAPRAASLIAASVYKLPSQFSAAALAEAEEAKMPALSGGREDLRAVPLVTIDGEDARDFDDAVFAEPDGDPKNEGGFHLLVAIADVAYYVKEGSALDADASLRGNSVYFPDRVIPMLPERLSNGLCSLKPDEDRYCIAVHLWIDRQGETKRYKFVRGLMRSHARLTYTEMENPKGIASEKIAGCAANLYAAFRALKKERDTRGTLEINLPEYKVQFDEAGHVGQIIPRQQLESHRLIEAFMVCANVAAANYIIKAQGHGIYRVHEEPSEDKLEDLRKFLGFSGYSLPKGAITPIHLNKVLHKAKAANDTAMIHTMVLRSQMQAFYDNRNVGHFGLGLKQYCHFTSPIRRYADLVVHRSLVALIEGKKYVGEHLKEIASHISETERTAMMAERDAMDRYKVSYMARQKEKVFAGSITSLNDHGLFVTLAGNGITGFVPVHMLGDDFYSYHQHSMSFKGRQNGEKYTIGDELKVRVMEADPLRASLIFKPETGEKMHKRSSGPKKYS